MHTSQASATIALNPQPLAFGGRGERACGWYASSEALREGLAVQELSDSELLSLWLQLRSAGTGVAGQPLLS